MKTNSSANLTKSGKFRHPIKFVCKAWAKALFCMGISFAMASPVLVEAQSPSTVLTNLSENDLTIAVQAGGTVSFSTDGTIFITNTITITNDVVLDGAGYSITISGNVSGPLFSVSTGVNFALQNLTLANVTNSGSPFSSGIPVPVTGGANGGVLFSQGNLFVNNCIFSNNIAQGGPTFWPELSVGSPGQGGAIYSSGFLAVSNSVFVKNSAIGGEDHGAPVGRSTSGGSATGGAIYNDDGTLVLNTVTFSNNAAIGDAGGSGVGGAVYSSAGDITAWNITVIGNNALGQGTQTTYGAEAGGLYFGGGNITISNSVISGNNSAGQGPGGGVFNVGTTLMSQCTISGNASLGLGGGVYNTGSLQITGSLLSSNAAIGGAGIMGCGGAIYNSGNILVSDSTLAGNVASGGGQAGSEGGAIANTGIAQLETTVLSNNVALNGPNLGACIFNIGSFVTDTNTIIQPGVSGTSSFTYDWQINGTNIADQSSSSFYLTNIQFSTAEVGSLIITSPTNSVAVTEVVNVLPSNAPLFEIQPVSESVMVGILQEVDLVAVAISTPAPVYQWQLNGTNVTGATDSRLSFPYLQLNETGTYTLIASNIYGVTTSQPAILTLYAVGLTPTRGGNGTVSINAGGRSISSFVLETSTNLIDWQPVITNALPWSFTDTKASTTPFRFYRTALAVTP